MADYERFAFPGLPDVNSVTGELLCQHMRRNGARRACHGSDYTTPFWMDVGPKADARTLLRTALTHRVAQVDALLDASLKALSE